METVPKKGNAPVLTAGKGISWMAALKRDKWLYLLLIPGLLYFLIFKYLPMWGVLIAFKDYSPYLGFWKSEWVGLGYFKDFFMNPDFFRLLRNTLMLASLDLLFAFPAPLILALLLNELRKAVYKRCIQTLIYVPHFVSWTIVVSITFVFFTVDTGVINKMVMSLTGNQISFLSDADWFRPMIVMQSIWKETGWGTILFLAALATVDQEQYEAAIMDGAGRFRRMWHITLPAIRSTIIVLLILRIGSFLNIGFEQVYLMTNSLNRSVADIFDTYVYMMGITQGAYSYSTAVGLFKSVVGIILIFGANYIAKKFDQEGLF
ncbi:sugar ABC transporter permease [Bacillus halotolerans]|uniref:ABC transporter permease n=1 Tax=Bacillus halotolerans TaxID=260554 RepID=UPI001D0D924B|nr:sugar ABC transporter permease [Bacillus halotolerans]MCC2117146.1 sugar ABC transporter permease [Bacillus halotolerans]